MCGYYRIFINLPLPAIVDFFPVRLAEIYSLFSFQLTGLLLGERGGQVHTKLSGSGGGSRGCPKILT